MRYIIINPATKRVFQPMRPGGDRWVDRDRVDPADTFPTEADARARLAQFDYFSSPGYDVVPL